MLTAAGCISTVPYARKDVNSIDLDAAAELGKIILNIPGFCALGLHVQAAMDLAKPGDIFMIDAGALRTGRFSASS